MGLMKGIAKFVYNMIVVQMLTQIVYIHNLSSINHIQQSPIKPTQKRSVAIWMQLLHVHGIQICHT